MRPSTYSSAKQPSIITFESVLYRMTRRSVVETSTFVQWTRFNVDNAVFALEGVLPDECVISIQTTFKALRNIKPNKASGLDNTPAWVLKDHADLLAPPLTAIFNCSLREGKLPNEWKMANIIPLPKVNPPASIYKDIRPISLTPIAAKLFEFIVMEWVDDTSVSNVDSKQFS